MYPVTTISISITIYYPCCNSVEGNRPLPKLFVFAYKRTGFGGSLQAVNIGLI